MMGMLIAGCFMFFLDSVPALLFPSGSLILTLTGGLPYYLSADIAAAFFAGTASFSVAPRINPFYFYILSFSLGITTLFIIVATLSMTTINAYGMIDRHVTALPTNLQNTMVLLSFIPSSAGMIYRIIKGHTVAKGIIFTVGTFMVAIFFTFAHDTQDLNTFIFCSILTLIGWILVIASFNLFKKTL
jgi:hypothetical protein